MWLGLVGIGLVGSGHGVGPPLIHSVELGWVRTRPNCYRYTIYFRHCILYLGS